MTIGRIPSVEGGIQPTIVDAKGDLIVGLAADSVGRLAAGTNGYTLVADSAETTGLKWAAPAAGGKVLQVVSATASTAISSSSATFTDTALSASITPSAATSKILVLVTGKGSKSNGSIDNSLALRLVRGSTAIFTQSALYTATTIQIQTFYSASYLDSPSTTSATTYKVQIASENGTSNVNFMVDNQTASIILMEIGA